MKRLLPLLVLAVAVAAVGAPWLFAANGDPPPFSAPDRSPGAPIAATISTVTGIAISPLLGTAAYGAFQYFQAKTDAARAALPWYAQWKFFGPALLIVGLVAAKDALGAALPPGWKKPLDVIETLENKISGLVAAGAVIPITIDSLSKIILSRTSGVDAAPAAVDLAMINLAQIDFSPLLTALTLPFALAVFAVVWMASHAINVLILLSPWGAIDAALKAARTAVLGFVAVTTVVNPWLAALLSGTIIIVAYFVAGWSFRLTVFGSIFCWDFLTFRWARFRPAAAENRMFTGGNLPAVPARTYGRLAKNGSDDLEFSYRPWLLFSRRTVRVPFAELALGRGFFVSSIVTANGDTYFLLPPRYRGHEEEIAQVYELPGGVRPAGFRKAWSAIRELFGGGVARTQFG